MHSKLLYYIAVTRGFYPLVEPDFGNKNSTTLSDLQAIAVFRQSNPGSSVTSPNLVGFYNFTEFSKLNSYSTMSSRSSAAALINRLYVPQESVLSFLASLTLLLPT